MLCYSAVAIVVAICISVNINAYSHSKLHIRSFINRLSSNNVNEVTTKTTKGNYCLNVTLHVKPGNGIISISTTIYCDVSCHLTFLI